MNCRMLLVALTMTLIAGCAASSKYFYVPEKYEDSFEVVYMAEQSKRIVVPAMKYHYVFESQSELLEILQSESDIGLHAEFDDFKLDNRNNVTGTFRLIAYDDSESSKREEFLKLGFEVADGKYSKKFLIKGVRYIPTDEQRQDAGRRTSTRYKVTFNYGKGPSEEEMGNAIKQAFGPVVSPIADIGKPLALGAAGVKIITLGAQSEGLVPIVAYSVGGWVILGALCSANGSTGCK